MGRHRLPAAPHRVDRRRTAARAGLLGASVAVVLATAAVTTGVVPVGSSFPYVGVAPAGSATDRPQARPTPPTRPTAPVEHQVGGLANLSGRASSAPGSATASPSGSPSASPSPSASASAAASPSPSAAAEAPERAATAPEPAAPQPVAPKPVLPKPEPVAPKPVPPKPEPVAPKPVAPKPVPAAPKPLPVAPKPVPVAPKPPTAAPTPDDGHSAEEAAVVTLVNQARARAGCGPVRANPPLAALAAAFSKDMAVRGFFDHTDPDGNTPWDRATNAGISGLGGENIARGQGDAQAAMNAWMNSPGHKANILNCEFRTLGVGVHVAAGGPWWTQDFGY
ncbi:CAP domain-containing protein [Streptomyces sp. NPDC059650]|uniref:CAP domain-containing protein n=1 Tax=Streptomyces sp. NPDC059650 TaxID=3346896 RepID=UPI00368D341A